MEKVRHPNEENRGALEEFPASSLWLKWPQSSKLDHRILKHTVCFGEKLPLKFQETSNTPIQSPNPGSGGAGETERYCVPGTLQSRAAVLQGRCWVPSLSPGLLLWKLRRLGDSHPFQDIGKADSGLGLWGSCPYTYLCTDYSWEVLGGRRYSTVLLVDSPLTQSMFPGVHGYDINVQDDPEKQCEIILSINKQVETRSRA